MLVLARKTDEQIVLDFSKMTDAELLALRETPITVEPVDIRGDKVRIGTEAPKSVQVHREEVWKEIKADAKRAEYAASRHGKMVERVKAENPVAVGGVPNPR